MIVTMDVYNAIDSFAPFCRQEKWDNSGLLCGGGSRPVTKAVTALDITKDVILEAEKLGAELIVSHHPVIFSPLKAVMSDSPVGMMLERGISAICTHTPFDASPVGMNKGLFDRLSSVLGLSDSFSPLEDMGDGFSVGRVYDLKTPLEAKEAAAAAGKALGCPVVRVTGSGIIRRIAISSGSGNSFPALAREMGADALLSGDFKHDVLVDSLNDGFILIDCGHFYTERIFAPMMRDLLKNAFPNLAVYAAESCTDPAGYVCAADVTE